MQIQPSELTPSDFYAIIEYTQIYKATSVQTRNSTLLDFNVVSEVLKRNRRTEVDVHF